MATEPINNKSRREIKFQNRRLYPLDVSNNIDKSTLYYDSNANLIMYNHNNEKKPSYKTVANKFVVVSGRNKPVPHPGYKVAQRSLNPVAKNNLYQSAIKFDNIKKKNKIEEKNNKKIGKERRAKKHKSWKGVESKHFESINIINQIHKCFCDSRYNYYYCRYCCYDGDYLLCHIYNKFVIGKIYTI